MGIMFVNRKKINKKIIVLILFVSLLVVLHFYILPTLNGAYNQDCYLKERDLTNLRYAVQKIGQTMTKYNVTYWLDYGTLLGAVKYQDILPWDGDADISYLLSDENVLVHKELYEAYGIRSNGLTASYKGLSIDYIRWKAMTGSWEGKKTTLLYKYYPDSILKKENVIVLNSHKLQTFPLSWVKPREKGTLHGVKLFIPNNPDQFLRHRYVFTYSLGLSFPYKWKCWIPCWLSKVRDCIP